MARLPEGIRPIVLLSGLVGAAVGLQAPAAASSLEAGSVALSPCRPDGVDETLMCGSYLVPENRRKPGGRKIRLGIVVVPARDTASATEPLYFFSGGPGQSATRFAPRMTQLWYRRKHHVVLIDQRGASAHDRLDCPYAGDEAPGSYLDLPYSAAFARSCRKKLETHFDLSRYSTFAAVEDFEDVRRAFGHRRISVAGISFGTYMAMVFMSRHPQAVKSAVLTSLVLPENRVPLNHAHAAQEGLDALARNCLADGPCRTDYGDIRAALEEVRKTLRAAPATVSVQPEWSPRPLSVSVDEVRFVEAVRALSYGGGRDLPFQLRSAREGDFQPLAEAALNYSRLAAADMALGLLLAVTCTEFVSRIRSDEVAPAAGDSYVGTRRAEQQIAACKEWPRTQPPLPSPRWIGARVPVLMISGDVDPVTGPAWGEIARLHFPNSLHVVVPGGHGVANDCSIAMAQQLLASADIATVDRSCLAALPSQSFKPWRALTAP